MYRTWGFGEFQYDKETYLAISERIPVHDNFYFCIKHTAGDFHRTASFNQSLNAGRHKQVVEVQAAREYEGKGAYPDYIGDGVINGFEEFKWVMKQNEVQSLRQIVNEENSLVKGIWTWSRGGGWDGPYINGANGKNGSVVVENGSELWADINAYVISHWAKDTSRSDRDYVMQYARDILGMGKKDAHIFYDICMKSAQAVLLGRGCNTQDYKPEVFWTRDQNIQYSLILKIIKSAIENDALDTLFYERRSSVETWEYIVELAEKLEANVPIKQYIITTSKYGYYLYAIYETLFLANGYAMLGNHQKEVQQAIDTYEALWIQWRELKENNPGCPTLFEKEDALLDLAGYNWNTGLDGAINPVRDLDQSGYLKSKYL